MKRFLAHQRQRLASQRQRLRHHRQRLGARRVGSLSALIPVLDRHPQLTWLSLDCFDTVVHRRTDPPQAVFELWADRFCAHLGDRAGTLSSAELARQRQTAEQACRDATTHGETTFLAIHQRLIADLFDDSDTAEEAALVASSMATELACERATLFAADGVEALQRYLKQRAIKLVITSDMYWPGDAVAALCRDVGLEPDLVLVSSDHAASKNRGPLFDQLREQVDCAPDQLLHVGDNLHSDYHQAIAHGVAAILLDDRADLGRRRQHRADRRRATIAGLQRCRPPPGNEKSTPSTAYRLGRDCFGPLLGLMMLRTMRTIIADAGRHQPLVGFVARDGWLLQRIAERLATCCPLVASWPAVCELRYLHLSRAACAAAMPGDPAERVASVFDFLGDHATPGAALQLLGLTGPDDLAGDSPWRDRWDERQATAAERTALATTLTADSALMARCQGAAEQRNQRLMGYLQAQGVTPHRAVHLVDLGWYASSQRHLGTILHHAYGDQAPSLTGHLLGNLNPSLELDTPGTNRLITGIAVDHRQPRATDDALFRATPLLELICQANTGTTLDYQHGDDGWQPVLGMAPAVPVAEREAFQRGVLDAADWLGQTLSQVAVDHEHLLADARRQLARLITNPRRHEAAAWRAFYFDTDAGTTHRHPVVDEQLPRLGWLRPRAFKQRIRQLAWVEGSLAASRVIGGRAVHRLWRWLQSRRGR